jgi:hypothetical protein
MERETFYNLDGTELEYQSHEGRDLCSFGVLMHPRASVKSVD